MEDWKFRCKKERDKKVLRLAQPRCWCHKVQTFQLDVLRHRCRKISMALRDKQRQTHSGTFIDNINSFLSYDFWIFLKPSLKGFQSCLHFVRSNGEDFKWLGILKIKQDRCPKLLRLWEIQHRFTWLWGVGLRIHWMTSQVETIYVSGRATISSKNFRKAHLFFLFENHVAWKNRPNGALFEL